MDNEILRLLGRLVCLLWWANFLACYFVFCYSIANYWHHFIFADVGNHQAQEFLSDVFFVEPSAAFFVQLAEINFVFVKTGLSDGELVEVHRLNEWRLLRSSSRYSSSSCFWRVIVFSKLSIVSLAISLLRLAISRLALSRA